MSQQAVAVSLRLPEEADQPFLRQLYHQVHAAEFAPLGLPEQGLAQLLDLQHRAQVSGYATQFPGAADHIVEVAGAPSGRILLSTGLDALHVVDLALVEQLRGQGLGAYLLSLVAAQADRHALPVRLSVRVGNPALRLYLRQSFVETGGDGLNLTLERPAATPLESTLPAFEALRGHVFRAYAPDGSAALLELRTVSTLVPGSLDCFAVEFMGACAHPLSLGLTRLVSVEGGKLLDVSLSPVSSDGNEICYQAVYNRQTLSPLSPENSTAT